MVVNIIVKKDVGYYDFSFIGIDGNGIVVLRGGYAYDKSAGLFDGYYRSGRNSVEKSYAIPKGLADYATAEKLCRKFMRDMLAEEKNLIVNQVIDF